MAQAGTVAVAPLALFATVTVGGLVCRGAGVRPAPDRARHGAPALGCAPAVEALTVLERMEGADSGVVGDTAEVSVVQ